jgi:hypothetical protein
MHSILHLSRHIQRGLAPRVAIAEGIKTTSFDQTSDGLETPQA